MGQPKLSNASTRPLIGIGPLAGLDATTDPYFLGATYVTDSNNFVPNHSYQGLAPIRGRLGATWFWDALITSVTIYYPHGNPAALVVCDASGGFAHQPISPTAPWTGIAVPSHGSHSPTGNPGAFARYLSWLFFTNNDPNALCYKFDKDYNATFWQIAQSPKKPDVDVTSPANGLIYGSAYYYRYTYAADNTTDPGLSLESSPSPPTGPIDIGVPLGPPGSNGATINQSPAPTLVPDTAGGTIPPGTYFIGTTWLTGAGESGLSKVANVTTSATGEICVTPQNPPGGATGFNIYTGTSAASMTQQGGTRSMTGVPNPCGTGGSYQEDYHTTGAPPPAFTGFLLPPSQPIVKTTSGGSLPARTEYYQLTYVSASGETTASPETPITLLANELAIVVSPAANANATGYNVYGSTTSAQEVLQNSSPIALGTNWPEPATGLILGQSAQIVAVGSADPQCTSINFYRIGGQSLGNWYFVGSEPNDLSGGSVTFLDNVPDSGITGQALVLARDVPAPFGSTFVHVERVFGFGYRAYTGWNGDHHGARPCDLWYSNFNEPWGFDNTNQVIPVGAEDSGDIAVAGAELSSIGILWKSKTVWALYGSTPTDLFVSKLFDVGAVTPHACFVALGVAFWLSRQGIYMFDGSTLTYLSKPVKKILDTFSEADFLACAGCFDDRIAWFSFPTQGISLGYDTVDQNWWKATLTSTLFTFDTEASSRPAAVDYVFGVDNPTGRSMDQWFASTKDLGAPILSTLLTRLGSNGQQIGTLRVRYLELITSQNIKSSDSVAVTIAANPASVNHTFTKTFGPSAVNLRQRASVPAGIQGDELQLAIAMTSSNLLVIEGAAAHGWVRRVYNVVN